MLTEQLRGDLGEIESATAILLATASDLSPNELLAPSLCEGWTRGHVLAHVALNADSIVKLLTWARTGTETHQYPSWEARAADIETYARASLDEHLDRLSTAHERFMASALAMPVDRWSFTVRGIAGDERPARTYLTARRREVEVHHVDLDSGYGPSDWPDSFVAAELEHAAAKMHSRFTSGGFTMAVRDRDAILEVGPHPAVRVTGIGSSLLMWLYGRSRGTGLDVEGGPLPHLGTWG